MKRRRFQSADSASGPLIVVGMWRSGTSLLYSLLNQHPEIALMYEADLYLLQPLFSRKGSSADWRDRWEFWNSAFSRHHLRKERIPVTVPDLSTAATAAWQEYAGSAVVMGEKSPNYYDCLPALAKQFPGARFIIIWRDLADICRSIVRARAGSSFFSKPGILHRALIGYQEMKSGRDALVSQGISVHEIQYEEMIKDTDLSMRGVCEFLDLNFDPRMTSLQGADDSPIYQGVHHKQVKGGKILRFKECEEVLSPQVRSKIQRYVNYWKKQSGGAWPLYPESDSSQSDSSQSDSPQPDTPGTLELWRDRMLFRALRGLDHFTEFVYCYAPFGWLQSYRAFKNRRHSKAHGAKSETLPAGAVRSVPETVHEEVVNSR
jgi:hypothetical protein